MRMCVHVHLPVNALPFSGLGAAKLALRVYADASAATRSAATACSTAASRAKQRRQTGCRIRAVLNS